MPAITPVGCTSKHLRAADYPPGFGAHDPILGKKPDRARGGRPHGARQPESKTVEQCITQDPRERCASALITKAAIDRWGRACSSVRPPRALPHLAANTLKRVSARQLTRPYAGGTTQAVAGC